MGKILSILIVLLLWASTCIAGNSYYICDTGDDDTGDGTSGTPWATISKAHVAAGSGDTIYFCSQGTWTGDWPVLTAEVGTTYDGATYGTGTRATIKANLYQPESNAGLGVVKILASNVTFRGFEVDANLGYLGGIYIGMEAGSGDIENIVIEECDVHNGADGITTEDAQIYYYGVIVSNRDSHTTRNVTIQNNTIHHWGHEALTVYPSWMVDNDRVEYVTIRGNEVHHAGMVPNPPNAASGTLLDIGTDSDYVTVEFNYVHDGRLGGIATTSYLLPTSYGPDDPNNFIIRYNIIAATSPAILIKADSSVLALSQTGSIYGNICIDGSIYFGGFNYSGSTISAYNNTVYLSAGNLNGLYLYETAQNTSGLTWKNNLIYSAASSPYAIYDYAGLLTESQHSNNLVYVPSGYVGWIDSVQKTMATIGAWEDTMVAADPSFTGGTLPTGFTGTYGINMVPNQTYFMPQVVIPATAINNGATLGAPYNDSINAAGQAGWSNRPIGAGYDIGAYEYGAWPNRGVTTGSFSGSIQ